MSTLFRPADQLPRDGSSQQDRLLAALDPASAPLDARTLQQQLATLQKLASQLRFANPDSSDQGGSDQDWHKLLQDSDHLLAWLQNPDPENSTAPEPHQLLLLTALQLMQKLRQRLNNLTERHLDYYYRDILRFSAQNAQPDCVHVLAQTIPGQQQARLPKGTLLNAGQDASGQPRCYTTEHELSINRARIDSLYTLFTQVQQTTPESIRHSLPTAEQPTALLRLALGEPQAGDALPWPEGWPAGDGNSEQLILSTFKQWLTFARQQLHLALFEVAELDSLLQKRQDNPQDWQQINQHVNHIGERRSGQAFDLKQQLGEQFQADNFNANLHAALGLSAQQQLFEGLSEVANMDQFYQRRDRDEVKAFLRTAPYHALADAQIDAEGLPQLHPEVLEMMQRKQRIDAEWQRINQLLNQAGRAKQQKPDFSVQQQAGFKADNFAHNLQQALPNLSFASLADDQVEAIPAYQARIRLIEQYLQLDAESARYLLSDILPVIRNGEAQRDLLQRCDKLLLQMRQQKSLQQHKQALAAIQGAPRQRFEAILALALNTQAELSILLARAHQQLSQENEQQQLMQYAERIQQGNRLTQQDWAWLLDICLKLQFSHQDQQDSALTRTERINQHAHPVALDSRQPWPSFGYAEQHSAQQAILGWAISSPVLAMRHGQRNISLSLEFDLSGFDQTQRQTMRALLHNDSLNDGQGPLQVEISTADGWQLPGKDADNNDSKASASIDGEKLFLNIDLHYPISTAAIISANALGINTGLPVLRLMLKPQWDQQQQTFVSPYESLYKLRLNSCHCSVKGVISDPLIRNDQSRLDASKPFEPFGSQPASGSRLFITDPELVSKKIEQIRFKLEWMKLPAENLATHYEDYAIKSELGGNNNKFEFHATLIEQGVEVKKYTQPLFNRSKAKTAKSVTLRDLKQHLKTQHSVVPKPAKDPAHWPRYLRCELGSIDFQHAVYPSELKTSPTLNPPYTPQLKQLEIGYDAFDDAVQMLHIHPFGYSRIDQQSQQPTNWLPAYQNRGELMISLAEAQAGQRISLLLQLLEGSANPDLAPTQPHWHYLDGDQWRKLDKGHVLRDQTRGLINSGIVELELPTANSSNLMPTGLYWLRLSVTGNPESLCRCIAIHTQAVSACFVDQQNDPEHYAQPLPAESIKKPHRPVSGVGKLWQPYTSFGGRPAESAQTLNTRISERLRHRNRALNQWDYEHLVLQAFPYLHKVKCLSAEQAGGPGHVRLIVIPDIARQLPADPLAPKASASQLADIKAFVEQRSPAGIQVHVSNADFIAVKVRIGISLHAEFDPGLARHQLNQALQRHLSPWAYAEGEEITIGGAIYANSIINFLERQPMVDYVQQPSLFRYQPESAHFEPIPHPGYGSAQGYHVSVLHPDQVLVSASEHNIDLIQADSILSEQNLDGIGYMKVGLDFIVAANPTNV